MARRVALRGVLFDGASGVRIPQRFAREIDRSRVEIPGFEPCDWEVLETGPTPDNEMYWDVWQYVLDHAEVTDDNGTVWTFEQDGDCWMVEKAGQRCDADDNLYVTHE
jgi:hypothetical protein